MNTLRIKLSFYTLLFLLLLNSCRQNTVSSGEFAYHKYFENLPFEMEVIREPEIPGKTVNILYFGAVGDGIHDNTEAINRALAQVSESGGGRVVIPAGIWMTGPIRILSNTELHAEENALIIFYSDTDRYPIIETSFEGLNTRRCVSPISARDAENITITGKGIFDGSGDKWRPVKKNKMTEGQWKELLASGGVTNDAGDMWYPSRESMNGHRVSDKFNNPRNLKTEAEWEAIKQWLRPVMVSLVKCKNVKLEGVTFRNSPCWGVHPLSCENLIISDIKVFNPWYSQNGDALDLESCKNVLVADNLFDAGDDGICMKSGKDEDGRRRGEACENVIICNNTVLHGHGGFVVGSEMSGGIKNIYVKDCTFTGTDAGIRFKSVRGRGGVVENIYIENIYMNDIPTDPLLFDLFYTGKSALEDLEENKSVVVTVVPEVTEETPSFRNIHIKGIYCKNARRAIFINGLPEMNIHNVTLEDIVISSKLGAEINHTDDISMNNIRIISEKGPEFTLRNVRNVTLNGKKYPDVALTPLLLPEE